MLKLLAILALVCAPVGASEPKSAGDSVDGVDGVELPNLELLLGQEEALAKAARQYDLRQKAFAAWDVALAKQYMDTGEDALAQSKFQQASRRYASVQRVYEEVLKHYPKNPRTLTYYGELLYDYLGEQPRALQNWKLANALDGKLADPLSNLAIHYFHNGDYELGLKNFDEVLKLEPDNPDFLYNIVQIYLINNVQVGQIRSWKQEKVYREAMKMSKKAAELLPTSYEIVKDYAVNFFAAERFGVKIDWKEAAEAWQKARGEAIDADDIFYAWLCEARAWLRLPNKESALACLREAQKLQPDSEVVKNLIQQARDMKD